MNKTQTQQEITSQLDGLTETMEREKIKLTPDISSFLKKNVEAVQTKLMQGEPVYPKDMEFIEKITKWIKMPKYLRDQRPSIELMENPVYKLTKEQKEKLIQKIASRFQENKSLHEELEWSRVKASLEANDDALWSINEMNEAGHEPDVYNADEEGFDIGTCLKQVPESGRNCVYDKEAADKVIKENPDHKFNGSAEAMAEEMKVEVMTFEQYIDILQTKGDFDTDTCCWLKTPVNTSPLIGSRRDKGVLRTNQYASYNTVKHWGWRGTLRVKWEK